MNESFVPLLTASATSSKENATILKNAARAGDPAGGTFTPLSIPDGPPSVANTATARHTQPAASHTHDQPKVTLQRNGDEVTGIQIECCCGQRIELACVY
jgi:hypothetical protein